jgi:hypothetical protein
VGSAPFVLAAPLRVQAEPETDLAAQVAVVFVYHSLAPRPAIDVLKVALLAVVEVEVLLLRHRDAIELRPVVVRRRLREFLERKRRHCP